MEVRRGMVIEVHRYDDPVESRNSGHGVRLEITCDKNRQFIFKERSRSWWWRLDLSLVLVDPDDPTQVVANLNLLMGIDQQVSRHRQARDIIVAAPFKKIAIRGLDDDY